MELRPELLTEAAREAAMGMVQPRRFAAELPARLWPEFGEEIGDGNGFVADFAEWNERRRSVQDEHAKPIWDQTVDQLGRRNGYDEMSRALARLERFIARVEEKAKSLRNAVVVLQYAAEVLKIEKERAGAETAVGEWLDDDGFRLERLWWKWWPNDGSRLLLVPELYALVGQMQPSLKVEDEETWGQVVDRVEANLHEATDRLEPYAVLESALEFQTAIIREAITSYAVTGSLPAYPESFAGCDDVLFPNDLPGALATPHANKVLFVEAAHAVIQENVPGRGKDELLRATAERCGWKRDFARVIGVAIGAYRPQVGRGRPIEAQENADRDQFVAVVGDYHGKLYPPSPGQIDDDAL